MTTYLVAAGNDPTLALEFYLYNARLAKSLLYPLNVTEVTLRNVVDETLVRAFGEEWHTNDAARDQLFSDESAAALDKAISRARSSARGKVIAELTFDFWSNLFRSEYAAFWRTRANRAFPYLERSHGRREIQGLARPITKLRNRVAHHEPLLDVNANDLLSKMYELTALRCPKTRDWMRHHTTTNVVLRNKPSAGQMLGATVARFMDKRGFEIVRPETTLAEAFTPGMRQSRALVCVDCGSIIGAFTPGQAMSFVAQRAMQTGGMIDLGEHTAADVLASDEMTKGCRVVPEQMPMTRAIEVLKEADIVLLVAANDDGGPAGVLLRAHRRY